jgi:hypothetical protein
MLCRPIPLRDVKPSSFPVASVSVAVPFSLLSGPCGWPPSFAKILLLLFCAE